MRKIILIIALISCTTLSSNAQEVLNSVRKQAQSVIDNPQSNPIIKKINYFEVEALNYMSMKAKEQMPDSSVEVLDKQAYAMSEFVSLYLKKLIEAQKLPKDTQKTLIHLFMDASYSNPMFNDNDKDLVLGFFSDQNSITRFSLDTDWRRALAAVQSKLK